MSTGAQQLFLFASLDFPGRTSLRPDEIAEKLGVSVRQILDLIEEGELCSINLASGKATKRWCTIPLEAYRAFILGRMTGPLRTEFMRSLPKQTLRELRRDIDALIATAA